MDNPFPSVATVSITGTYLDSRRAWPNIARDSIRILREENAKYLTTYPSVGEGRALALWGRVGSGKTHTLHQALRHQSEPDTPLPEALTVYVRVKGGDPQDFYAALMGSFPRPILTRMALRAFNRYAWDSLPSGPTRSQAVDDVTSAETDVVETRWGATEDFRAAARAGILSWSETKRLQENHFDTIQAGVDNFERPFQLLLGEELAGTAHRWIVGDELSREDRDRIGVRENIRGIERIRVAVNLLMALARRARIPLVIACDEMHTMLEADREGTRATNEALLRCLVEDAINEGTFLVVAVRDDAWVGLSSELRYRFSGPAIEVPPLGRVEGRRLVAAHLCDDARGDSIAASIADVPDSWLHPFTASAIEVLHTFTQGNARTFLQQLHLVTQLAIDRRETEIDEAVTRAAVQEWAQDVPTVGDVQEAVTRACGIRGWHLESTPVRHGHDLVISGGINRAPMLVRIREGLTGSMESTAFQELLTGIPSDQHARVLLVVQGFASEEPLERLKAAPYRVLVAKSKPKLPEQVDAALAELGGPEAAGTPETEEAIRAKLDALLAGLGQITAERVRAEDRLAKRLTDTLEAQARSKAMSDWSSLHREWIGERTRLDAKARAAAKAREALTVSDFVRADERAGQTARNLLRAASSAAALALFLVAGLSGSLPAVFGSGHRALADTLLLGGAFGFLLVAVLSWRHLPGPDGTPRSEREVDLLSWIRAEGRSGVARVGFGARARAFRAVRGRVAGIGFERRLRAEPIPFVQRLLVQNRPREHEQDLALQILGAQDVSVEAKSVVLQCWNLTVRGSANGDAGSGHGGSRRPGDALSALSAYYGHSTQSRSMLESFLVRISRYTVPGAAEDPQWRTAELAQAYATGHERDLAQAIETAEEAELRAAVDILSPQNDDGLVTCYWLTDAQPDFLRSYLFLRKVLFFKERDQGVVRLVLEEMSRR